MDFRTVIKPLDFVGTLSHKTPIMLIGSCFSDNIGKRLRQRLFPVMVNPFGTLYNPASILSVIRRIITRKEFEPSELFFHQGVYRNFLCHSSLAETDADTTINTMNTALHEAYNFILSASAIFLTYGTSWVFRHNQSDTIVANCHKLPAQEFTRNILSIDQATEIITQTITEIRSLNKNIKIYISVSPIRHLADGTHGNQISKSTLLLAIENVIANNSGIVYIPAYELLNDDLRDYRFYESDMCHPTDVASDYVYEYIAESFFTESTKNLAARCKKFTAMLNHRQLTESETAHEAYMKSIADKRQELSASNPELELALKLY